jgi:hypothetical protein
MGRGDAVNMHDVLTGSTPDGRASDGHGDTTCGNWTKSGEGSAIVGHHDRRASTRAPAKSWNSSPDRALRADALMATGGDGRLLLLRRQLTGPGPRPARVGDLRQRLAQLLLPEGRTTRATSRPSSGKTRVGHSFTREAAAQRPPGTVLHLQVAQPGVRLQGGRRSSAGQLRTSRTSSCRSPAPWGRCTRPPPHAAARSGHRSGSWGDCRTAGAARSQRLPPEAVGTPGA